MDQVNADQVAMLREALAGTGWLDRTRDFGRAVRSSAKRPGGLLLLGTPAEEPWHLAAHLDDESRLSGLAELKPTLVRWAPPRDAPAHLAIGLDRLERAGRGEALLVVAPDMAPVPLLERVDDARRTGAVILTMGSDARELTGLAHEALPIPALDGPVSFDGAQHLVSAAAGQRTTATRRPGPRERLARLLDTLSGPVPD